LTALGITPASLGNSPFYQKRKREGKYNWKQLLPKRMITK